MGLETQWFYGGSTEKRERDGVEKKNLILKSK